jgi:hypothetical protein
MFLSGDHHDVFREAGVPVFSIGVAESATGRSDYPELPPREARVDHRLARHLHASAIPAAPSDERGAVIASGVEIGGPRISETSHTGVPDPGWR